MAANASAWKEPPDHLASSDQRDNTVRREAVQIILAEDNMTDALLVQEAIAQYNLPVCLHVLKDGDEAFDFIRRAETEETAPCPAIALLDLNLPKRNGIEILERLRNSPKFGSIPVIIVTASDSPTDRMETAKRGANRYFRKPMGYDEFLKIGAVIQEVLEDLP